MNLALPALLGKDAFLRLNTSKQDGFYVRVGKNRFAPPRETIDPAFAKTVHRLAWRASTTVDFLLKDGNVERYIGNARAIRSALTEKQLQELERLGKARFVELFPSQGDEMPLAPVEPEKT